MSDASDKAPFATASSTPVPDPTLLTTQQLNQQIAALKELVFTRLDAGDKAVELFNENLTRVPTALAVEMAHMKEWIEEKFRTVYVQFSTIQTQFKERDVRVEDNKTAATTAVNAALSAAKEAVQEQNKSFEKSIDKSERATLEQITQQRVLLQSIEKSINEKIAAQDTRVIRLETMITASQTAKVENRESSGASAYILFSVVTAILALTGILIAIFKH